MWPLSSVKITSALRINLSSVRVMRKASPEFPQTHVVSFKLSGIKDI